MVLLALDMCTLLATRPGLVAWVGGISVSGTSTAPAAGGSSSMGLDYYSRPCTVQYQVCPVRKHSRMLGTSMPRMVRERPLCIPLARGEEPQSAYRARRTGQWAGLSQMSRHISGGLITNRHPDPASPSQLHCNAPRCAALLLRRPFEPSDPDSLFAFPGRPPTHVHALQLPIPQPAVPPGRTT